MLRERAINFEERLVWGGGDALRAIAAALRAGFDVVRSPFERLAWTLEQRVVWPLQDRTGGWGPPPRSAGAAALAVAAVAALGLGLLLLASGGGEDLRTARIVAVRVARQPPSQPKATAAPPVLHGAAPLLAPVKPQGPATSEAVEADGKASPGTEAASASSSAPEPATSQMPPAVAGPAPVAVARRFADVFVLYETGQVDAEVRSTLHATATPKLAAELLRRPPRLPANVEVPRAKVLNVVPGPQVGDDCTVSVSLLRLGLSSELRLRMHREASGWRIEEVLG